MTLKPQPQGKFHIRRARPVSRPAIIAAGPPVELHITAVGAQGDGAAGNGVFAPLTLAGETVLAAVAGKRAEVTQIVEASPERIAPPGPHFGACGGCALQHWDHTPYLAWKVEQIRLALGWEQIETDILPAFAAPPASRRRIALHARRGSRDAARIGFKARRSWDVVPITTCPVSDPRLVAAFPALARLAAALFEHPKSAPTLHVTLTATGLDIDITGVEAASGGLSADARMRMAETASAADFARVTLGGEIVYGARAPMVRIGTAAGALPAGAFLQAVPQAERVMADFALAASEGASRVADLYCGVGSFALRLAEQAGVWAADSSAPAIKALLTAQSTAPSLKAIDAYARDLARRPMLSAEMAKMDAVVFDPPRAGALEQSQQIATSKVGKVVGGSCNPQTFARDARVLTDAGFTLERVLPVDQFLWSPHVELVGVFSR